MSNSQNKEMIYHFSKVILEIDNDCFKFESKMNLLMNELVINFPFVKDFQTYFEILTNKFIQYNGQSDRLSDEITLFILCLLKSFLIENKSEKIEIINEFSQIFLKESHAILSYYKHEHHLFAKWLEICLLLDSNVYKIKENQQNIDNILENLYVVSVYTKEIYFYDSICKLLLLISKTENLFRGSIEEIVNKMVKNEEENFSIFFSKIYENEDFENREESFTLIELSIKKIEVLFGNFEIPCFKNYEFIEKIIKMIENQFQDTYQLDCLSSLLAIVNSSHFWRFRDIFTVK